MAGCGLKYFQDPDQQSGVHVGLMQSLQRWSTVSAPADPGETIHNRIQNRSVRMDSDGILEIRKSTGCNLLFGRPSARALDFLLGEIG